MTNARRCERSHHLSGKSVRFPSYRAARDASKVQKSSARKNEVREPDQFDRYRPDLTQKIIRFFFAAKRGFLFVSRLGKRGVRVVTDVERGMRWTLAVSMRRAAWRRTAKSCGPGAPMQALSFVGNILRVNGGNQAWSPGRSRISRNTIAQGRPDDPLSPVVLPRAFLLHADPGCGGHPVFPAPSVFRGLRSMHNSGVSRRGTAKAYHVAR
jgi:hypothetical protein